MNLLYCDILPVMNFTQQLRAAEAHLSNVDQHMHAIITKYGECTIAPHANYYEELVSSIISQQLSVKAAETIWKRFVALYDGKTPTPEQIAETDIEDIRKVGASYAKANYIKDLALHILDGKLDLVHIATLPNNVVIEQLVDIKGIGEWSAHMFMIFSLGRLDVLPWGDLGVRKSMQEVYELPSLPNKAEMIAVADKNNWAPYQSVASWYLWKNLDNK
jgi:DNA-3-methyladenine glycosylase II